MLGEWAEAIEIFEVKDGKITGRWGTPDRATLMEQLGLAPQIVIDQLGDG